MKNKLSISRYSIKVKLITLGAVEASGIPMLIMILVTNKEGWSFLGWEF